jgi:hypothetical protein
MAKVPMMRGKMLKLSYETTGAERAMAYGSSRRHHLEQEQRALIADETERLQRIAKEEAPKDTGIFADGIYSEVNQRITGDLSAEIGVRGKHAFLLDYIIGGTKPHQIPKGGSAAQMAKGHPLSFYWENGPNGPGLYHFWSVQHPGTRPNPFHQRALARWRPGMLRRIGLLGMRVREQRAR